MNFHIGKIYNIPSNLYFYKSNQPRLWAEYCKKVKFPVKVEYNPYNSSCIIFPENDEISKSESDNDSWVDMKKIL